MPLSCSFQTLHRAVHQRLGVEDGVDQVLGDLGAAPHAAVLLAAGAAEREQPGAAAFRGELVRDAAANETDGLDAHTLAPWTGRPFRGASPGTALSRAPGVVEPAAPVSVRKTSSSVGRRTPRSATGMPDSSMRRAAASSVCTRSDVGSVTLWARMSATGWPAPSPVSTVTRRSTSVARVARTSR